MRHLKQMAAVFPVLLALLPVGILQAQEIEASGPEVFLRGIPVMLTVTAPEVGVVVITSATGDQLATATAEVGENLIEVTITDGSQLPLSIHVGTHSTTFDAPALPGLVSILPPLVAIAMALIFKEVIVSLLAGIWLGGLFLAGYNPFAALFMVAGRFAKDAMAHPDHASIVVFSMLLGGMVGVLSKMGATTAIVEALTPVATTRKRGLLATWGAGLAIFFDDYANTLVVGNTMRPITDRLKISREKLAYIVDSTAAPVAAIMFVSTWVGYEISLIGDGYALASSQNASNPEIVAGLDSLTPFATFIQTIPYLFYPILAIVMVVLLILSGRDFGPMLKAERRAFSGGGVFRPGASLATDMGQGELVDGSAKGVSWWHGVLPIACLIVVVIGGLVYTGLEGIAEGEPAGLREIFSNADPFIPLLWGSLMACVVSVSLAVFGKILSLQESIDGVVDGIRSMIVAMIILVCAWSLADVTNSIGTASYLSSALSDAIPIKLIPVSVFALSGAMAFATGTSWGTMAILLPIVIPLTVALGGIDVVPGGADAGILFSSMAAVLSGAIFGDHCSPISDTTILSSMASGCDHIDHVRTQLPYALTVAGVGGIGSIAVAYGFPTMLALLLGLGAIAGVVFGVGQKVETG
jgi:Na+/H+ antiporter NhaC